MGMAAEADKVRIVKQAEAAADAQHLAGQGIARQRAAIIEGLKDSITHGTGETLSSEKVSELLLITQYFETLRDKGADCLYSNWSRRCFGHRWPDPQRRPAGVCSPWTSFHEVMRKVECDAAKLALCLEREANSCYLSDLSGLSLPAGAPLTPRDCTEYAERHIFRLSNMHASQM